MADQGVINTAYKVASEMGASAKVLLALFEAALVESNFENLNHGPDGSLGYLQQRSSQGWPSPMDVAIATRSFVSRAKPIEGQYSTAGKLAQAVQRSAFPDRYDQRQTEAQRLLASVGGAGTTIGQAGQALAGGLGAVNDGIAGSINQAADGLRSMASGLSSVGKLADLGMKLALPTNITRAVVGALGIVFIFVGIAQLGRQVVR